MGSLSHLIHMSGQGNKLSWQRILKMLNLEPKYLKSNHQSGPIQEETLQDPILADEDGTLKKSKKKLMFFPYLSEDKILDGVSPHNCAFAKKVRTKS